MTDPRAVLCVPTFRRPDWLRDTLASIQSQTFTDFGLVIVDNDAAARAGAMTAAELTAGWPQPVVIVTEASQGNCFAINRAFATAQDRFPGAEFLLMLDDDEWASPAWLEHMITTAECFQADIVGGPVTRRFDGPASSGVIRHPLFGSINAPSGPVDIIHGSGNCLIRRRVFDTLASPWLDVRYNFLGGGDMDFFTRCKRSGTSFAWSQDAIVHERVPAERTDPHWIMQRSLRTGVINFTIQQRGPDGSAVALAFRTLASLGLAPLRAMALLLSTGAILPATHPILVSVGRLRAALGYAPEPYRATTAGS